MSNEPEKDPSGLEMIIGGIVAIFIGYYLSFIVLGWLFIIGGVLGIIIGIGQIIHLVGTNIIRNFVPIVAISLHLISIYNLMEYRLSTRSLFFPPDDSLLTTAYMFFILGFLVEVYQVISRKDAEFGYNSEFAKQFPKFAKYVEIRWTCHYFPVIFVLLIHFLMDYNINEILMSVFIFVFPLMGSYFTLPNVRLNSDDRVMGNFIGSLLYALSVLSLLENEVNKHLWWILLIVHFFIGTYFAITNEYNEGADWKPKWQIVKTKDYSDNEY